MQYYNWLPTIANIPSVSHLFRSCVWWSSFTTFWAFYCWSPIHDTQCLVKITLNIVRCLASNVHVWQNIINAVSSEARTKHPCTLTCNHHLLNSTVKHEETPESSMLRPDLNYSFFLNRITSHTALQLHIKWCQKVITRWVS